MDEKLIARFWSYVDKNGPTIRLELGPCWNWRRALNASGYGVAWDGERTQLAHRLAWFLEHGVFPDECACHACDNPRCCRASHLFDGDRAANLLDMRTKGRGVSPPLDLTVGEDHGPAKLTEAEALEIIRRGYAGEFVKDLGAEFSVSKSNVSAILTGRSWAHLPRPERRVRFRRVITDELVAFIKSSPKKGTELALELDMPTSTISAIRNR